MPSYEVTASIRIAWAIQAPDEDTAQSIACALVQGVDDAVVVANGMASRLVVDGRTRVQVCEVRPDDESLHGGAR